MFYLTLPLLAQSPLDEEVVPPALNGDNKESTENFGYNSMQTLLGVNAEFLDSKEQESTIKREVELLYPQSSDS